MYLSYIHTQIFIKMYKCIVNTDAAYSVII